jgi:hypothetical protein
MFMLTHTYFLQKILLSAGLRDAEPDIFVYNIAPDLLALHPQISPAQTHILQRSLQIPSRYPKSAYVIFHLLVDDLSHHGYISSGEQEEFNLNSKGYSYVKGIPLIKSILDLHKIIDKEITYGHAVYQSHLIIEMIYDLVILRHLDSFNTVDVLTDAIEYTVNRKMDEFIATVKWLFGLEEKEIREVMEGALVFITRESMERILNIEGRINLYKDKFGLQSDERLFYDSLNNMFQLAMDLINDDEQFFLETVQEIKNFKNFNLFR